MTEFTPEEIKTALRNPAGWHTLAHAALAYIEELEAKQAKAVEALEGVRVFVRDLEPYADQGHTLVPALHKACTTLAELNYDERSEKKG